MTQSLPLDRQVCFAGIKRLAEAESPTVHANACVCLCTACVPACIRGSAANSF